MTNFDIFSKSLSKDGKDFEKIFVPWFLKNDPEWKVVVDKVWLFEDCPYKWNRGVDIGTDIIFKHKNGEIWAVQAKNIKKNNQISSAEVNSFLADSSKKHIAKKLLISTTDNISKNSLSKINTHDKEVKIYSYSDFIKSSIKYPKNINGLKNYKKTKPKEPRLYQKKIVKSIQNKFKKNTKGQLIMACGTGKTLVSMWTAEKLNAKKILVVLPSLGLVSQLTKEWIANSRKFKSYDILTVCSKKTLKEEDLDEFNFSYSNYFLPLAADNKNGEIKKFLATKNNHIVFCTYHSLKVLSESQKKVSSHIFDFIICDEAHWCAGNENSDYSLILHDHKIKGKKRLFCTATPRRYSARIKKNADLRGIEMIDMSNKELFGEPFETYQFSKAISEKQLSDYEINIIGVSDEDISSIINRRELLKSIGNKSIDAKSLATQAGVLKIIKKNKINKMITYHSRTRHANNFKSSIVSTNKCMSFKQNIISDYIDGKMSPIHRKQILNKFARIPTKNVGILSNAKVLTEGIDVPAIDAVAFIDPKKSQLEIIQAVGRALRQHKTKTGKSHVVVPIFVDQKGRLEKNDQIIQKNSMRDIYNVVNALKSHDDLLSYELDEFRKNLGRQPAHNTNRISKITIDLPMNIPRSFYDNLTVRIVESTTAAWNFMYGLFLKYVETNDNKLSPAFVSYGTIVDGFNLFGWVDKQRQAYRAKLLPLERQKKLEEFENRGWSWNAKDTTWEKSYRVFSQFVKENEHAIIPYSYIDKKTKIKLGHWLDHQRQRKKYFEKKKPDRVERLNSLGMIWEPRSEEENIKLDLYVKYVKEKEDQYIEKDKVYKQINIGSFYRNSIRGKFDKLPRKIQKILDNYPEFSPPSELEIKWNKKFNILKMFFHKYGHSWLTQKIVDCSFRKGIDRDLDLPKLYSWVLDQRNNLNKHRNSNKVSVLQKERIKKLDSIHFVWNTRDEQLENSIQILNEFYKKEGHSRPILSLNKISKMNAQDKKNAMKLRSVALNLRARYKGTKIGKRIENMFHDWYWPQKGRQFKRRTY